MAGERAFEYLLGCPEMDEETRALLWRSKESGGGFEDALAGLQNAKDEPGKKRLQDLTAALVGMFNAMGHGFTLRGTLELRNPPEVAYMVKTFLAQFDAIFTLNQDTLLEQHYFDQMVGGRFNGCITPGLKPLDASQVYRREQERIAIKQPDPDHFRVASEKQPYFKLHGSCNWIGGPNGERILIMGGAKAINIGRFPILSWYHEEFDAALSRQGARLMIIGYGFGDVHINNAIGRGVERGLKIFIIDPAGVDVLDKRQKEPLGRGRDEYMDKLAPQIIGASRRPLSSTFNDDVVEHARIMKFFA